MPSEVFLHFLALGTGRYQGNARKGVPLLCVGVWELVPRAENAAASERGELREGEKGKAETRRRGSVGARWTVPPREGSCPCKPVHTRGACSTCTLTIVFCCTHSIAFTSKRMLTLQMCSNTLVSHRGGVNAATHTRQPTEDTLLPVTPHKCTDVFSKQQFCTHMHSSPYSIALGCTHVHIHVPYIDTWSPLPRHMHNTNTQMLTRGHTFLHTHVHT